MTFVVKYRKNVCIKDIGIIRDIKDKISELSENYEVEILEIECGIDQIARIYEKINTRKKDWIPKITHLLSEHFDCVILEDLNIQGMQHFNSGLSKSVSLDFSWHHFVNILRYKMEQKEKHLILVDRYFPSSKLCSGCGYKNKDLELYDREWTCPTCQTHHHRDIKASENIEREGRRILRENNITIMSNTDTAVGTTVNAFGEDVRLFLGEQLSMNYESIAL